MTERLAELNSNKTKFLRIFLAATIIIGSFIYVYRCNSNPPGFFVDESSISYNAYTISQTGKDEYGTSWPLFFRAFGDYKNPVYIYLLALVFKIVGPGILAARLQSTIAGILTAILLGLLAQMSSRTPSPRAGLVGLLVMVTAFLTPWLFEISRVVLEVALYPLFLVLFLLSVYRASQQSRWDWLSVLFVSTSLMMLTYTYSVGRLLAPLLAFGLIFFFTRKRIVGILLTWACYLLSLIPLIAYQREHPGALMERFKLISNQKQGEAIWLNAWTFCRHFFGNLNPWLLFVKGDQSIYQVAHLYGKPVLLLATFFLLVIGLWQVATDLRRDQFWRFVVYGTLAAVVPASLTVDYLHILRLVALPIFILLLTAPGISWLVKGKQRMQQVTIWVFLILTLAQGLLFQWQYHSSVNSPLRRHLFDAAYPEQIFDAALRLGQKPIFVSDPANTPYIQTYWYGTLHGLPATDIVRLGPEDIPPKGAVVIGNNQVCQITNPVAEVDSYVLYLADQPHKLSPLPANAYRAELVILKSPETVHIGEKFTLTVLVKNAGDVVWPGCQPGPRDLQLFLSSHWLDTNQNTLREEGRSPFTAALAPGKTTTLELPLTAPESRGQYFLDLDLVQERVTWFAQKGSAVTRLAVKVE